MELEHLKIARLLIPGLISIVLLLPLSIKDFQFSSFLENLNLESIQLKYGLIIPLVGGIYYLLNVRGIFLKNHLKKIHANIKDKLLTPCLTIPEIHNSESLLREGDTLIQIFYSFVDSDNTLKEKAKNIRLNGLIWSTIADFSAMCLLCIPVYAINFILLKRSDYIIIMFILIALLIVFSELLMPIATSKHIKLSNEQLDYIRKLLCLQLCEKIKTVATNSANLNK